MHASLVSLPWTLRGTFDSWFVPQREEAFTARSSLGSALKDRRDDLVAEAQQGQHRAELESDAVNRAPARSNCWLVNGRW